MQMPLLQDIALLLGLAVFVLLAFQRMKIPTIIGFLVTGMIAGPYGFGLVHGGHDVEILAEIGVILLLFIIGMEFSLKTLQQIKNAVLIGGAIQVGLTIGLTAVLTNVLGFSWPEAVFAGFLFSLSSTAIVMKVLQEKGEVHSPHGKIALAILIFQDIIVVPMMLAAPLMAGKSANIGAELAWMLAKAAGVIAVVLLAARYITPTLLYQVAKTKNKELFLMTILVICFSAAFLTSFAGLSLALGAFIAGLVISESEYSHQATGNILPFREVFASIFFISIGMLLDLRFLVNHLPVILGLTAAVLAGKFLAASAAGLVLKYPARVAFQGGLALFQVGEFAFILSRVGLDNGLINPEVNQYFLSISIISMAVTPFVLPRSESIACRILNLPITQRLNALGQKYNPLTNEADIREMEDHLVIIGYGINGRNVARAARFANIPYTIIELNAQTVRQERANGEAIVFGDAVHSIILEHVNIHKARIAVVAISDPVATKTIIGNIRGLSQSIHLIIRTRTIGEISDHIRLGADEVIPEEFETSIEIFTRVLHKYLIPDGDIQEVIHEIRSDNYEMFCSDKAVPAQPRRRSPLAPVNVTSLRVSREQGGLLGRSMAENRIRNNYNIQVIGIHRDGDYLEDISPDTRIEMGDLLYVAGKSEDIRTFEQAVCGLQ
ncbi:MAG: cation:proton antiporter [Lewinellaceae bacterium]|nr:cation:proton antiporter [Lewinellaceae bacterium]